MAVMPSRRGQGMGRRLHALGLAELARRGARKYIGSTGRKNAAMVAFSRANDCIVEG